MKGKKGLGDKERIEFGPMTWIVGSWLHVRFPNNLFSDKVTVTGLWGAVFRQ